MPLPGNGSSYDPVMFFLLFLIAVVIAIAMYMRARRAEARVQQATQQASSAQHMLHGQTAQQAAALEERARRAVAASRGSYDGHVAEHAFPVAPHHGYHPKDIFHWGGVVDYLVLDGLHDVRHNGRDPKTLTVVFADVKWGSARLSDVQRAVMSAVNEGRVRAEQWTGREEQGSLAYTRRELR